MCDWITCVNTHELCRNVLRQRRGQTFTQIISFFMMVNKKRHTRENREKFVKLFIILKFEINEYMGRNKSFKNCRNLTYIFSGWSRCVKYNVKTNGGALSFYDAFFSFFRTCNMFALFLYRVDCDKLV